MSLASRMAMQAVLTPMPAAPGGKRAPLAEHFHGDPVLRYLGRTGGKAGSGN